jgi:hypothetical protein
LQEQFDLYSSINLKRMAVPPSPSQLKPRSSLFSRLINLTGAKRGGVGISRNRFLQYTLLLGLIAGLAFSLALWGYEAILLIQAHVAYPWIPIVVGTLLCVLICTLAAFLTWLVNRAFLGIVFWVLASRLIAELAITLPLKITPALMMFFEPGLHSRLPVYPMNDTFQTWAGFGTVWLAIFLGILGLLQLTMVESAVPATTSAGRLAPYFVFALVMVLASVLSSNMINEQLRAPLIATDRLIEFAVDHQNTDVDPATARQMHLSSLDTISDLINRPRRLFLGQYDDYYGQVDVLIDFHGAWADCTTVSGQPVFCNSISNP